MSAVTIEQFQAAMAILSNTEADVATRAQASTVIATFTTQTQHALKAAQRAMATTVHFKKTEKGSIGLYNLPGYEMVDGTETRKYLKDGEEATRKFPVTLTPRQWVKVREVVLSGGLDDMLSANPNTADAIKNNPIN